MTTFLAELGKGLADRWVGTLLAPGLLLLAAVVAAGHLGQAHALDPGHLLAWTGSLATDPASRNPGILALAAAGILAAAAAAGLAAAALGVLVEHAWLLPGTRQPVRALTSWRQRRWRDADQAVDQAIRQAARLVDRSRPRRAVADTGSRQNTSPSAADQSATVRRHPPSAPPPQGQPDVAEPDISAALARRDAICLVEPDRPTWIGDRLRAADLRVYRTYDLELTSAWPRLWAVAPDSLRGDLAAAHDAYSSAARLTGWALLYLALTAQWWPAALIAGVTLTTAHIKARAATSALADLVETTVDLHGCDLASQLGIRCDGPLTPDVGYAITTRLRKDDAAAPHRPA